MASKPTSKTRFVVTLEAGPGDVPEIVGLRKFLKMVLRIAGLKCVKIDLAETVEPENIIDREI